ncbi:MAG: hypothetical protein KIT84_22845 [Labilithrix sp.]|nr:hypothetical protein [Labilithrix sp.]MCW5813884.1 hypothetical protein [Labilithrix sp.]
MSIASAVKVAVGIVLAVLLGCEPPPGTESGGGGGGTLGDAGGSTTGPLQPLDADGLCKKLVGQCGIGLSQELCLNEYFPLRVTSACAAAIPSATCADLASTSSSISQTCFPPCSAGTAPACNGDGTITLCTASNTRQVRDCRDACTAEGFTAWTGSCGTTFDGQVAVTPQCWCR